MVDIPVVTSPTTVVVSGATEEIELSVDVGATGPRGSKIFSGVNNPPSSPTNDLIYLGVSQFKVGDMYVQRLSGSINIYYYVSNIGSEQWSAPTSIDAGLPLSGGTLQGILDMGSNKITNLPDPVSTLDAVNKFYVDEKVGDGPVSGPVTSVANSIAMFDDTGGKLLADSGVVIDENNNLDLKNNKITNVATPTVDTEATNKAYVDTSHKVRVVDEVTTTYSITSSNHIIFANSVTPFTITLPAIGTTGQEFIVKNINTGEVTVDAAVLIDGETSQPLYEYSSKTFIDNGASWSIL